MTNLTNQELAENNKNLEAQVKDLERLVERLDEDIDDIQQSARHIARQICVGLEEHFKLVLKVIGSRTVDESIDVHDLRNSITDTRATVNLLKTLSR